MSIPAEEMSRETKETTPSLSPESEKKETTLGMLSRLLRLDKPKTPTDKETPTEPLQTFYAVYIPCEIKKGPDEEALHVYKEREKALELVRRYKPARFKTFRSMQDAVAFALRGADPDVVENANSLMGEKPYPFKGPSPQEMVALRKAIEAGAAGVADTLWDNPRYLVSSGSTPTILQEGARYNALHVAAKALNADAANLVLTTVGDPQFVQRLYGGDADEHTCREFAALLVDRYLNTPDKALNETPLHFASKFGAADVVDVLTSFPQCNVAAVNKFGEQPKDVICKRVATHNPQTVEKIKSMLRERFYVPVYHSEDDSRQPTIGDIFTPSTPPTVNADPLSPRLEIRAYAGPMEAREASHFRRRWKTPPRSARGGGGGGGAVVRSPAFRLNETSKGLESVGRELAEQMKVGWKEYWPFLDTFTDLKSTEGLNLLENYLSKQYLAAYSVYISNSEIITPPHSPQESISIIAPSSPSSPLSPISDLCQAFKGCVLNSNSRPSKFREGLIMSRARRLYQTPTESNGDHIPLSNHMVSQLMCIERTCQVFAKRIADGLNVSLTADSDVAEESLKSEANHLLHTMSSYMDDERFQEIDFRLIHSRLSQLIVYNLLQHTNDSDDLKTLLECLEMVRNPSDETVGSDDEKKVYRYVRRVRTADIRLHVVCLAKLTSEELREGKGEVRGPSAGQEACSAVWATARRCACAWARDGLDRGSRRSASFKRKQRRASSPHYVMYAGDCDADGVADVNCNSASGDTPRTFSINVDKCQVLPSTELLSEDESEKSSCSEDENGYETASEVLEGDAEAGGGGGGSDDEDMADTSDRPAVETFIYGEAPCKTDRLVYEAVRAAAVDAARWPHLYRWRHVVGLYPPDKRNSWLPAPLPDDSIATPIRGTLHIGNTLTSTPISAKRRPEQSAVSRTPRKGEASASETTRCVPLQVSNWLRVTGPNSPRSALANKNVDHNVSFGF